LVRNTPEPDVPWHAGISVHVLFVSGSFSWIVYEAPFDQVRDWMGRY
jgi:hypothetical protein